MRTLRDYIFETAGNYTSKDISWMFETFTKKLRKEKVETYEDIDKIFTEEVREPYELGNDSLFKKLDPKSVQNIIQNNYIANIKVIYVLEWIGSKLRDNSIRNYNGSIVHKINPDKLLYCEFEKIQNKVLFYIYEGENR